MTQYQVKNEPMELTTIQQFLDKLVNGVVVPLFIVSIYSDSEQGCTGEQIWGIYSEKKLIEMCQTASQTDNADICLF